MSNNFTKSFLLFIFYVFFYNWQLFAQTVIGKGNFDFKSQTYLWKVERTIQNDYKISIAKNTDLATANSFELVDLQFETFRTSFLQAVTKFYPSVAGKPALDDVETDQLNVEAGNVFFSVYQQSIGIDPNVPRAGHIAFQQKVKLYEGSDTDSMGEVQVDSISVEFYRGNIENIIIHGTYKNEPIHFINLYPIGFSTFRDYGNLAIKRVYEAKNSSAKFIKLTELFEYIPELGLNLKDYSPLDTVITFKVQQVNRNVLYKEGTAQILTARIYSDFVGLDATEPNGLIQTELSKRINILNNKIPFPKSGRPALVAGLFSYVEPLMVLSKIEENKKYLPVISKDAISAEGTLTNSNHVINLDLLRYQNFSFGADLNVVTVDVEKLKSSFYINFGARLGRTSMVDTLVRINGGKVVSTGRTETFTVNFLRYYPEIVWQVKPDTRFGFFASLRSSRIALYDDRVKQIYDYENFVNGDENVKWQNWVGTIQFTAFLSPNKNGDFFFRYAYNNHYFDRNRNYAQVQVGYSFNVLKKR